MRGFKRLKGGRRYRLEGEVTASELISFAQVLIGRRFRRGTVLTSSQLTKEYLSLKIAQYHFEVFCAVYLDNQHRVICFEQLFQGTIDGCAVYPREVLKRALELNSAAVIFAHNHPSGIAEPSIADISITKRLKAALDTVDIRVLDHFVVGGDEVISFAERGLL